MRCVVSNNTKSHCAAVLSGTPQGILLGPMLFVIYINDLAEVVPGKYLFVDDTNVFRKINSEDGRILQNDIDRMVRYMAVKISSW